MFSLCVHECKESKTLPAIGTYKSLFTKKYEIFAVGPYDDSNLPVEEYARAIFHYFTLHMIGNIACCNTCVYTVYHSVFDIGR